MKTASKSNEIKLIWEATLEYFVSLLVTGAFLSSILKQIGVSDAVSGVVSSFISISCVAQLFSGTILSQRSCVKRKLMLFSIFSQLLFAALYIIPYFPVSRAFRTVLFIIIILAAYLLLNIITPVRYKWMMDFVNSDRRGIFTANKEITSLIGGMLFSLLMGRVVDIYKAAGKDETGFILCGAASAMVTLVYAFVFASIREMPVHGEQSRIPLKTTFSTLFSNKVLRKLIWVDILWKCAVYISTPYYGTYLIGELGFSLTYVSVLGIVYSLVRASVSRLCGRTADRYGWANLLTKCLCVAALGFLVNTFTRPENGRILYTAYYVLYAVSMAGINGGLSNITFDYISAEEFSIAMGARNTVSGVTGFSISLLGGIILNRIQQKGLYLLGHPVYAQQVLSLISFFMIAGLVLYMVTVIKKMPRVSQTKEN